MLVLGIYVTNKCNGKEQLLEITSSVNERVGKVSTVLGDAGYRAEDKVKAVQEQGTIVKVTRKLNSWLLKSY